MHITDTQLIAKAKAVARNRKISDSMSVGYVGCALVTSTGHVYAGASIESACGVGNCAESTAIGTMLTHNEQRISRIVAVDAKGRIYPPCGRCREVMRQADEKNLQTNVIIGKKKAVKLKALLPYIWQDIAYPKRKRTS